MFGRATCTMHIFLNSIHHMKTSEYAANKTAKMVGKNLMHSLGMIKKQIAYECKVACMDKSYSEHILCSYLTPSPTNWALYLS